MINKRLGKIVGKLDDCSEWIDELMSEFDEQDDDFYSKEDILRLNRALDDLSLASDSLFEKTKEIYVDVYEK